MKLIQLMGTAIAAIGVLLTSVAIAGAIPAEIIGHVQGSEVNMHEYPDVDSYSPHYVLVGQYVEVLNYTEGSDDYIWYYIEYPPSGATGWVRGDFVRTYTTEGYL